MVMYLHTPHIPIQFMAGNNNYSLLVRGEIGRQLVNEKNQFLSRKVIPGQLNEI